MFPLFESFLTESGTYVGIRPDDESKELIISYCSLLGIAKPVEADDLHCTLMYSRKEVFPDLEPSTKYTATPSGLKLLGHPKPALVMVLDCPELKDRFNALHDGTGAQYDYDEYIPHITLEYDISVTEEELKELTHPENEIPELTLTNEYKEELKEPT